jgi:hypothetical protein
MNHEIRTEKDLENLIGQYETIRMDFKSSRILDADKDKSQIVLNIAKEVSAFANTEGGVLLIGIETGKDAEKAIAVAISEGVDPSIRKPEWLQHIVASNISPPLNGIIVRTIPLSGAKIGRVAYVIEIPKGETAYQSSADFKYYGRHELESKALADNEIRLRMHRKRDAHAVIEIFTASKMTAEQEFNQRQAQLADMDATEKSEREYAEKSEDVYFIPPGRKKALDRRRKNLVAPKQVFDEYKFEFGIRNDGQITIRDCMLVFVIKADVDAEFEEMPVGKRVECHFLPESTIRQTSAHLGGTREVVPIRQTKLFPEEVMSFPDAKLVMHYPAGAIPKECTFHWTLYLDDTPSVSGEIDLAKVMASLK